MVYPKRSLEERFWLHVDRRGPDECWPWKAATYPRGYGALSLAGGRGQVTASRVALAVHGSPVPADMMALHRCNNPTCCNPAHLYIGSYAENMRDKIAAGHHLAGPAGPRAKLRTVDVTNIRCLWASTKHLNQSDRRRFSFVRLGRMYGVWPSTIHRITSRRTWS